MARCAAAENRLASRPRSGCSIAAVTGPAAVRTSGSAGPSTPEAGGGVGGHATAPQRPARQQTEPQPAQAVHRLLVAAGQPPASVASSSWWTIPACSPSPATVRTGGSPRAAGSASSRATAPGRVRRPRLGEVGQPEDRVGGVAELGGQVDEVGDDGRAGPTGGGCGFAGSSGTTSGTPTSRSGSAGSGPSHPAAPRPCSGITACRRRADDGEVAAWLRAEPPVVVDRELDRAAAGRRPGVGTRGRVRRRDDGDVFTVGQERRGDRSLATLRPEASSSTCACRAERFSGWS